MKHDKVILDIEVLRAVAILVTLVNHLDLLFPWKLGHSAPWQHYLTLWGGVDLFFCISGFVIARSLLAQPATGLWRTAIPFWIRRAGRILPSAWLWLALTVLASLATGMKSIWGTAGDNGVDAVAAVIYLANLHWLNCFHDGATVCNRISYALSPYWSLSLEEQFYLLFPYMIAATNRRTLPWILGAAVLAQLFLPRFSWDPLWAFRTDALLLGVLLAYWRGWDPAWLARPWIRVPLAGLLLLLLAVIPSPFDKLSFSTGLLALDCAGLVWLASLDRGYILGRGMAARALAWIGARSYAIYLVHLPVFLLTRSLWTALKPGTEFAGNYTLRFALTAFLLLALLVEINFHLVERPLRRAGRRLAENFASRRNYATETEISRI